MYQLMACSLLSALLLPNAVTTVADGSLCSLPSSKDDMLGGSRDLSTEEAMVTLVFRPWDGLGAAWGRAPGPFRLPTKSACTTHRR
jgi:hypothetical protein